MTKNALAAIETDVKLKPPVLSENFMWSGYWVMTMGRVAGYEGLVTFGNIVNLTNSDVLITNNITEGSSDRPLIYNEGQVIGIVTRVQIKIASHLMRRGIWILSVRN